VNCNGDAQTADAADCRSLELSSLSACSRPVRKTELATVVVGRLYQLAIQLLTTRDIETLSTFKRFIARTRMFALQKGMDSAYIRTVTDANNNNARRYQGNFQTDARDDVRNNNNNNICKLAVQLQLATKRDKTGLPRDAGNLAGLKVAQI